MNIHGNMDYTSIIGSIGLFGACGSSDSEIKNLKMLDVNIDINVCGHVAVGSICGYNNGYIYNSFADGEINVNKINSKELSIFIIGGICGSSKIENCYNAVNISSDLDISNASHGYESGIGGIAGACDYGGAGIVGIYKNCYNIGQINGQNKGAVCGNGNNMSYCYYLTGTCEEQESTSGVCQSMSVAQMKSKSAFTNWDFENTWVIDSTSSYKYPQLRSCMQVPVTEVEITSVPEKTIYTSGEKLDLTGGKVFINHEDNSSGELELTENMLGEYNMEQIGKQSITVNYINKSASYDIIINPQPVSNLKISSLTEDSASLSWDRVSGAAGYIIYKYDSENKKWNEYQRVGKTNFTDDKENLSSDDFKYAVSSYVNIDDVDYISEKTEILKPIDFSRAIINIDDIICDGEAQTVVPEVSYNGKILTEGTDYDITGGDYEVKTPGQYKLILSGKGNFAGDQEVEFNVICNHDWGENGKNNTCTICGEMRYLMGDANLDGKVTMEDADYIISMIVQGKADELPVCADYNNDSYINPSDAYLICCDINKTTPHTSDGEINLGLNYTGGYKGEEAPIMVFSLADEFCAFDYTIGIDSQFKIKGNYTESFLVQEIQKGITAYAYINEEENTIRFTGYSKTPITGDAISIGCFYATIPNYSEIGLYETWFDTNAEIYVGSSNDNTKNLYLSSGIFEVAEEILSGDVSGNGKIDLQDVIIIAKFLLNPEILTLNQQIIADYDGNGKVDLQDAIAIARYLLKK